MDTFGIVQSTTLFGFVGACLFGTMGGKKMPLNAGVKMVKKLNRSSILVKYDRIIIQKA